MMGFFSNGLPDKVLFIIHKEGERKFSPAFRFGISSTNQFTKQKGTADEGDSYFTWAETSTRNYSAIVGYQRERKLKIATFFFGIDLNPGFSQIKGTNKYPGKYKNYILTATPFVGLKFPLSSSFSTSIEMGVSQCYMQGEYFAPCFTYAETNDNNYLTKTSIPYSLTLNYHF